MIILHLKVSQTLTKLSYDYLTLKSESDLNQTIIISKLLYLIILHWL